MLKSLRYLPPLFQTQKVLKHLKHSITNQVMLVDKVSYQSQCPGKGIDHQDILHT